MMGKLPDNVYEEMEGRNGKTYTGEDLKELRKKDRQEAARKQLEKDESFKGKASAIIEDVANAIPKAVGLNKNSPSVGYATAARKQRIEDAKKELGYKKGGSVKSSASKRADGAAQRGKTRGKMY